jgi:hypothetical protein
MERGYLNPKLNPKELTYAHGAKIPGLDAGAASMPRSALSRSGAASFARKRAIRSLFFSFVGAESPANQNSPRLSPLVRV